MSLSTYDGLKEEIISWSHRDDLDLKIDTFIQMAEFEMYNNSAQVLTIRGQETLLDTVTSGINLALPTDYQSFREVRLLIPEGEGKLNFRTPEQMNRQPDTGLPTQFTVTSQIEFNRTPDQNYNIRLQYYKLPTPLSSSNQTNEVLNTNPNIYLFGALAALFKHAVDDEQSASYFQLFTNAIKGTNRSNKKGRYGPAPAITVQGSTP